jgi:chromate transporter
VGGVVAGSLFVLPAALILWLLSWLYVSAGDVDWIMAIFYGLQPAVVAIVAIAILRIGKRLCGTLFPGWLRRSPSLQSFSSRCPSGLIVAAAIAGLLGSHVVPGLFSDFK